MGPLIRTSALCLFTSCLIFSPVLQIFPWWPSMKRWSPLKMPCLISLSAHFLATAPVWQLVLLRPDFCKADSLLFADWWGLYSLADVIRYCSFSKDNYDLLMLVFCHLFQLCLSFRFLLPRLLLLQEPPVNEGSMPHKVTPHWSAKYNSCVK